MNGLVEKEKDLIKFAQKVIGFRLQVLNACKKKGIKPPTDEQISAYVNDYGLHVNDFMADYIEHEGMFRIVEYYTPLEQKTLDATLSKLSDKKLIELWNTFIEESSIYGEDSCIYDLSDDDDSHFLATNMGRDELFKVSQLVISGQARYIQWLSMNDNSIKVVKDVQSIIKVYWGEMFERIMLYPSAYGFDVEIYAEGDGSTYFDDVFFPIIAEEVGYKIDGDKGTITKIEKK